MRKIGLFCLIMCLALVGCGQRHKNEPLWIVEGVGECDLALPIWRAISTEKSELNTGEDFSVKFYYCPVDAYLESYSNLESVNCTLTMKMGGFDENNQTIDDEEIEIKTIENFSEKLYVEYYRNDIRYVAAMEEITVPADWFSYEKGAVVFFVTFEYVLADSSPQFESGGISLYYLKSGNTILLFDSYYHFSNYKK